MSHAINSHIFTSTKPCINKAVHELLICCFAVLSISKHSGAIIKYDIKMSYELPWKQRFKNVRWEHAFPRHCRNRKKEFFEAFSSKFSSDKMFLCNNSDQTGFSDTFTSAGALGSGWNPRLSNSDFNTSLRAQMVLMHRKSCLIPILQKTATCCTFFRNLLFLQPWGLTTKGLQNPAN